MKNKRGSAKYIMSLGHFCSDFAQATLSAVLPFLIAAHHYSYATAAVLVMVSNLVGSVIQPVFGHLADKIDRPHLMSLGVIMACGGMAVVGLIPNYAGLCIAVIISGTGVAMFHPQGARMVNKMASEDNIGISLGIFSFGGNAGFTLGPVVASGVITIFGLKGSLVFFIPAIVFCALMIYFCKGYESESPEQVTGETGTTVKEKDRWGTFITLSVFVMFRSVIFNSIGTFLILYFTDVFGLTKATGSAFLSIFYCISAVASLLGGKLGDSVGYKKCLITSSIILCVSTVLFALSGSVVLCVAILLPYGIGINLGYSSMVTLGQKYLPNRIGLASGVTLGLSVSMGGIVAPILGKIGDAFGLTYVFYLIAVIALIPLVISFILPEK